ncbi:MAG: hypothetical protein ABSH35_27250 [Isosphaeraceae bacterium]|jgi:hypothetical protein
MWRTPLGERVLRGAEWNLFRKGLSTLWDFVEDSSYDPDLCFTEVGVFDRLEPAQKLGMLALVGTALHDKDVPCPELSALSEGTFAAVYRVIRLLIETETLEEGVSLQSDEGPSVRELVLLAARKTRSSVELPEISSNDMDLWDDVLDCLMDRVLWEDRDFEEEELFLDSGPEITGFLKEQLGIADDYFIGVAPDPDPTQLDSIRESLRRLCKRPLRGQEEHDRGEESENPGE